MVHWKNEREHTSAMFFAAGGAVRAPTPILPSQYPVVYTEMNDRRAGKSSWCTALQCVDF
jgi:hypothetical protein